MKRPAIEISQDILDQYPEVAVGYVVVGNLHYINHTDEVINEVSNVNIPAGIDIQNLVELPQIARWRRVYESSGVKPKTFKSSIEALMRRFLKEEYRPIIPLVDLYNYISVENILSAGGYDWSTLTGTLTLRHGQTGDKFIPLNGKEDINVEASHIIYADEAQDDNVVCWMWNHKDSRRTMLTTQTSTGLFLFDALSIDERPALQNAVNELVRYLEILKGEVKVSGILDADKPTLHL